MKRQGRLALVLFLCLILLPNLARQAIAAEVISNSANWQDVYSTVLYGNLGGKNPHFLTGTAHGPIMLYGIPKSADVIEIITSADRPFYIGYQSLMESKGYTGVDELIFENANLELAKRLPSISQYIILDDAYGYNALSVAPFAVKGKYYVLFANRRNIDDVIEFLDSKNNVEVITYGHLERLVRMALAKYNPEILNSESGSRFQNNMLIIDKYAEIGSVKQVILSNGEFIEASMMSGAEPVLFIGKNNVPQEVKDYIEKRGIDIGVLIGNELIGSATDIRRQVGISVFVKFARGSRVPGGTINPVEDLDRFPMPIYKLSLSIVSIVYNRATGQLEVTYRNNENIAAFFRSTITILNQDGETVIVDGDQDTLFIDSEETKTVVYTKISEVDATLITAGLTGDIYTIFGESKNSLDNVLRGTFPVELIDVKDDAEIEIIELIYDRATGKFYVTVENIGIVDAYVSIEIVDLWVDGAYVTLSSDEVIKIEPGQKKQIPIAADMADEDISDERNSKITVRGIYGERRQSLIKVKTKVFDLKIREFDAIKYAIIIVPIAIMIIILWLMIGRKRKRCERCRALNKKNAQHCIKCGRQLK